MGYFVTHQSMDQTRSTPIPSVDAYPQRPDTATDATPDASETLLSRPFPLNIPEPTPEVPELPSLANPDSHQLSDPGPGSPVPQGDTQHRYPSRGRLYNHLKSDLLVSFKEGGR